MKKPFSILLAVVVFAANMYCACVTGIHATARRVDSAQNPHAHCHSTPTEETGGCHDEKPSEQGHGSRTCSHCTGTVTADTAKAKTALPSLDLYPTLFVNFATNQAVSAGLFYGPALDRSGLSPPLDPPTLFNLSCCLNN